MIPLPPSNARPIFEQIVTDPDPAAKLKAMVGSSRPTVESEFREFKGCQDGNGNQLSQREIKKIWSEAIAGFANTGGGVLIWGLDCRKDQDGIDQVTGLKLADNAEALASRLRELVHEAVSPPVNGIEVIAFPESERVDQGFVVCFVPESPFKPHRQEMGGKLWPMRVGDSFKDIPPSILRNLFAPQLNSELWLQVDWKKSEDVKDALSVHVHLENRGPSTLEAPRLSARFKDGATDVHVGGDFIQSRGPVYNGQSGGLHDVHPGEEIEALRLVLLKPQWWQYGVASAEIELRVFGRSQHPKCCLILLDERECGMRVGGKSLEVGLFVLDHNET